MFKQDPHPIYNSLLENEYKILEVEKIRNTKWYELLCQNHKVIMGIDSNTTHIYEYLGCQKIRYGVLPKLNLQYIEEKLKVSIVINKLKSILVNSLDIKNIQFMKLIVFEIMNLYPQIETISFLKMDKNKQDSIIFTDQNKQIYELRSDDIYKPMNNFYFITNLKMTSYINVKNFSNHEILKSLEEVFIIKKSLNLNFNIQKII